MMKFNEIFRFEINYQLRHFSTWLLFAVFLLFGFMIMRIVTLTDDTYLNAPATIAFFTVFASSMWVVFGGVVAGDAATRDIQTHMYPLTYVTPVSKLSYLGGRFFGALVLNTVIMLILYAGFILSHYGPGANTEFIGPFRLTAYLSNYCLLALPTVIVTTAIQFAAAALSGRAIASYIVSIGIIIFSQFGGTTVRYMLEWKVLGGMMDFLGTTIISEMEGWTPIDKNHRLIQLEGRWLWNRVMWFGVAAVSLTITYFRFHMAHVISTGRLFGRFRQQGNAVLPVSSAIPDKFQMLNMKASSFELAHSARWFVLKTYLRQGAVIAGTSFRVIARSRSGLTLVAALAIGTGLFAAEYMEFYGVPLFARTQEVLSVLTPSLSGYRTPWIIIPLLTIFYAGELVWLEREAGINELYNTTPVPEWVMFLGKFTGLGLIITIWVCFLMIGGIINQLVMNYHHFEISVYLKALFGIQLTNYLLFALLVFVIHVLVNQKYIGHMTAFCAYAYIIFSSMIGVEHNMLVYASDTGWFYSDMAGFGPYIKSWLIFKIYWVVWALLLGLIGSMFWVRSKESGFTRRFHLANHRYAKYKITIAITLVFVLLSGGFIFYNTNVLNNYMSTADRMEMQAEYERRYGKYEGIPQPALAGTRLRVEIYPDDHAADITGTYQLVNKSNVNIDSIHISTIPYLGITEISFDREAGPVVLDEPLGYRIYFLKKRLEPGDSLQLNFKIQIKSQGFSNDGVDASVVENGSCIENDWMPVIGYNEDRRLRDARDREKYGLPTRPARPSLYNVMARYDARHAELMNFEAIVGTSKDQVAVAPGALLRTWTENNRKYFHYVTNAPILNEYTIFSARYALREAQWVPYPSDQGSESKRGEFKGIANPVTIQIFYHPTHDANILRMIESAKASLEYYSREFGAYPYSHFRVLERPGPGRGMHAETMTIDHPEGYSLMNPQPGGLDLPYHIMAHEVAHQWWGIYLAPAPVEGSGFLVESFATYSAMQVVEETLGYDHLIRYLSQMRLEYEVPRSRAAPPLLQASNRFMNYRKGPFALFALRNYIGKDSVNNAMRNLLRNYTPNPPLPTTLDFYRELQIVTPDSLQYLIHDLFAANTFWELKTEEASAQQMASGNWHVTLKVEARKVVVDSMGIETNIPMNDWIELGVYASPEVDGILPKAIYLHKHRIRTGKQTIVLNLPDRPARAGIDPNHLLIDPEMENNVVEVGLKE